MEQVIDKELALSKVSIQLGAANWGRVEELEARSGYYVCQRLSDGHPAIRIENIPAEPVFPRVRSVAFLPPTCAVRLQPLERPIRALNCIFEKSFFEATTEIEPEQWAEHTDALLAIQNKRLETLMQQIYAELIEPGFASDLLIEAASTMVLVEMGRHGRERLASAGADGNAVRGLAPWQLRRIRERVESSREIGYPDLGELARLCGISQSHLMRTFKASTGWQIHKYIAEERLKAAKAMLSEDRLGLKEISARLGFCSPAYFATAFRRMTGVTPTEFRRRVCVEGLGES